MSGSASYKSYAYCLCDRTETETRCTVRPASRIAITPIIHPPPQHKPDDAEHKTDGERHRSGPKRTQVRPLNVEPVTATAPINNPIPITFRPSPRKPEIHNLPSTSRSPRRHTWPEQVPSVDRDGLKKIIGNDRETCRRTLSPVDFDQKFMGKALCDCQTGKWQNHFLPTPVHNPPNSLDVQREYP